MTTPTLYTRGNLIIPKKINPQEANAMKTSIPIDYIMEKISVTLPPAQGEYRPFNIKSYGEKVFLIRSGTGSGKSTSIAPELYLRYGNRINRTIGITQPRILTTIDIPSKTIVNIPRFSAMELEKNLGYQTHEFRRFTSDRSSVMFMITGTLENHIKTMSGKAFMNKYGVLIIDEIHERDLQVDTILLLIKNFLIHNWKDPQCPTVILMSATFDPNLFLEYFQIPSRNFFDVAGISYTIHEVFPEKDVGNYVSYSTNKALEVHNNTEDYSGDMRDIIIFVSGEADGSKILRRLNNINKTLFQEHKDVFIPIFLTARTYKLGATEYINMFSRIEQITVKIRIDEKQHTARPKRRIFVATNVAETGVTIDTLKYCIDTGFQISVEFNPEYGCKTALTKNITKSMALQRRGRVGRLGEGIWMPCYTRETFNLLPDYQLSKMLTDDISSSMISILYAESRAELINTPEVPREQRKCGEVFKMHKLMDKNYFKILNKNIIQLSEIDFIEPPSAGMLSYVFEKLYALGFINHNYEIIPFGYFAGLLQRMTIENMRMLFSGYIHGAYIMDLVTIASFLTVKHVLGNKYMPTNIMGKDENTNLFYRKVIIADDFIDKIFLFNEFMTVINSLNKNIVETAEKWCEDRDISYYGMTMIIAHRDNMMFNLISQGFNPFYNSLGLSPNQYNLTTILKNNLEEGIEEIRKIKKCIYDGYRMHMVRWNHITGKYHTYHRSIHINIPSKILDPFLVEQSMPKFVILSGMTVKRARDGFSYEISGDGYVSVIDGFIDIDRFYLTA